MGEVAFWTPAQVGAFLDRVDVSTSEHIITEQRKRGGKLLASYPRHVDAGPMQRAMLYLFVATGARRGEVCGLRWSDLDMVRGVATIRRARMMVNGAVKLSKPKTKRGRRVVSLDPDTIAALEVWRVRQTEDRRDYGAAWEDADGYVFTHAVRFSSPVRYGVPIRPDWVTRTFQRIAREAGLPPLRLHGLRHSWATTAHLNGVGLRAIADQLGHANTSVTDRVYTATLQRVQEEAAAKVSTSISGTRAQAGRGEWDKIGTENGTTKNVVGLKRQSA